jgi:hypothetical protein
VCENNYARFKSQSAMTSLAILEPVNIVHANAGDPSNLFAFLHELKELMNAKFVSLESLLHKSLAENNALHGKFEQLSERCDYLESCLTDMKYEVDRPNREVIMNNVAVFGVPESEAGSPRAVMEKIGAMVSFTLNDSNVNAVKKLLKLKTRKSPR